MYGTGHIPLTDVPTVRGHGVSDAEQKVREMVCLSLQERFLEE